MSTLRHLSQCWGSLCMAVCERAYQNTGAARNPVYPAPHGAQPYGRVATEVFTEKLVRSRMLGRTNYFVSDPELVGRVLVDDSTSW